MVVNEEQLVVLLATVLASCGSVFVFNLTFEALFNSLALGELHRKGKGTEKQKYVVRYLTVGVNCMVKCSPVTCIYCPVLFCLPIYDPTHTHPIAKIGC